MPIIQAYECPKTKKLFKSKAQYKEHLKNLARKSLDKKCRQKIIDSRLAVFKTMRETCGTAEKIEQFIKDNIAVFWENACHNSAFHKDDKMPEDFECLEFKIQASYRDNVSNSHRCPMNGGVTNWHRKDGLPLGYSGFHGRVRFKFSHQAPGFSNDMWDKTGLDTGSGGGGLTNGTYEIYMFEADWPALQQRIEEAKRERMVNQIKTGNPSELRISV
jgi:hypothetical protein